MTTTITFSAVGPLVQDPSTIRAAIVAEATLLSPGLTTNLPGTLIEDITSTDVPAVLQAQQAKQDVISSISPSAANLYLLNLLGQVYGVMQGIGSNTSVYAQFYGTPGYTIPNGTIISDGTYSYVTQDSSIINSDGSSNLVYSVATIAGAWAVPAGTVVNILSSIPTGVQLSVTNPSPGIPQTSEQTPDQYRTQVMTAGLVASTGTPQMMKTMVAQVSGVNPVLISVVEIPPTTGTPAFYNAIVGGGDPYAVANALWLSTGNPGILTGSVLTVSSATNANPCLVTTGLLHQFVTGNTVILQNMNGMASLNGVPYTVTYNDPYSFYINTDTTSLGSYTGGGYATPNNRNVTVTIYDPPDQYDITYIIPPQQQVVMTITWQTTLNTAISSAAISQLAAQNIVDYITSIGPGGYINYLEVQSIFQTSIVTAVPTNTLVTCLISTTIDGIAIAPAPDESVIVGDPQGYYFMNAANITFVRG